MSHEYLVVEKSLALRGSAELIGAKNAVLVIMASLLLTHGVSRLSNVPASHDVYQMIELLQELGAVVTFDSSNHLLTVDTRSLSGWKVRPEIMKKMRASVLVMGPLLARFGRAEIALPGGCVIGARPIDYHVQGFSRLGVTIDMHQELLTASVASRMLPAKIVLDYPSVGATENILMAATLIPGTTQIINAALEPEVYDLIEVLRAMGASIDILPSARLVITGVDELKPVEHSIIPDRLEAGALLIATAATGGSIQLPHARAQDLDVVLYKLDQMGHAITIGSNDRGIGLVAHPAPKAVSFKTIPYPGFPTDLQAPMMAAQCIAEGVSVVEETVFENRMLHVSQLQKMGAQIKINGSKATITGVDQLYGTSVIASDIRASCALVVAGLVAQGTTSIAGIHHWRRGYEALEKKLALLGARIYCKSDNYDALFDQRIQEGVNSPRVG